MYTDIIEKYAYTHRGQIMYYTDMSTHVKKLLIKNIKFIYQIGFTIANPMKERGYTFYQKSTNTKAKKCLKHNYAKQKKKKMI